MSTPEEIQNRIEATRAGLSRDVNRLSEKVSPGRAVSRRVDRVRGSVNSLRDRVMGSADDGTGVRGAAGTVGDAGSSMGSSVADTATAMGSSVGAAPEKMRRQAQGNPLAAGLIAFGTGWLLATLAPATDAERRLAEQAEDKAGRLAEPVKEGAQEVAANMKEPARQAVDEVRSTAGDKAAETADQARSATADVRDQVRP